MPTLVSALISRIRRRADFVNSPFLHDTNDLVPWINGSHKELWELLCTIYGPPFGMATEEVTVTVSQFTAPLVAQYSVYKLLRVDCAFDGVRTPMRRMNLADETLVPPQDWTADTDIGYQLENSTSVSGIGSGESNYVPALRFNPAPKAVHIVRAYYVPAAFEITSASVEHIEGELDKWDEYIVVDCAIKAKNKSDEDTRALMIEKAALKQRIVDSAPNRDAARPNTVADVQSLFGGSSARDWWW